MADPESAAALELSAPPIVMSGGSSSALPPAPAAPARLLPAEPDPTSLRARLMELARRLDPVLARGAFWSFLITAGGMGLGFLTQVILARTVGSAQYGTYLYVLGWTNVAGLICTLELSGASVRYVSAYGASGQWSLLRGFLRRSHQIVIASAAIVAVLGLVIVPLLPSVPRSAMGLTIAACALFPISALLQLKAGCLQGLKRVVAAQAPSLVLRPLLFGVAVLVAWRMIGPSLGAAGAVACQILATGVALIVSTRYLRRALPNEVRGAAPSYDLRDWVRTSVHFIGISFSQLLLSAQSDLLIVGTLLGANEAGLYGAASQFAILVSFGATAIVFIAQPMIADLYARQRQDELQRLVSQIVLLALGVSTPVFLVLAAFGRPLLGLYGARFEGAYSVLLILAAAQLVSATVGMLVGYLLTMTPHQKEAGRVIAATAILNLAITAVLTPMFGAVGTATATLIATVARSVGLVVLARKLLAVRVVPRLATR